MLALLLGLALPASAAAQDERPLVYVFAIDGLDGDRVDAGGAPFIQSLLRGTDARSTYWPESRAQMIAETNPNHVAMATGAFPGRSGLPGNSFAIYNRSADEDSCTTGQSQGTSSETGPQTDDGQGPNVVSGESPDCLLAETLFKAIDRQPNPDDITTAGIFGKPKLGRIFSGRRPDGRLWADYLWTPCESPSDDTPYCRDVPINPITRYAVDDGVVMDEVMRSVREGVPADGRTKRPDYTFVNLPQVDSAGHATGAGAVYDQAIVMADAQIRRFVDQQKALGLWRRTVIIFASDHSMDTTPEKTSLDQRFRTAGLSPDDYEIVQNGSASLVYLTDRRSAGRFTLLRRMRAAALGIGSSSTPLLDESPVTEALYREDNPADGGAAHTLTRVHPGWRLTSFRTGDLVVTHDPGGAFSDPINPLTGNHGGPQTRDNFMAVSGGNPIIRQQQVAGRALPGFDDTLSNPGQSENVDVAPTVARLLGREAPAQNQGRFLREAFFGDLLPEEPVAAPVRRLRLTVSPRRVRAGRRTTFRFRVTARSSDTIAPPLQCRSRRLQSAGRGDARACAASHRVVPVRRALVRFAGARGRTNRRGYVRITRRLNRRGVRTARATRSGYRPGRTHVRVVGALGLTG